MLEVPASRDQEQEAGVRGNRGREVVQGDQETMKTGLEGKGPLVDQDHKQIKT